MIPRILDKLIWESGAQLESGGNTRLDYEYSISV